MVSSNGRIKRLTRVRGGKNEERDSPPNVPAYSRRRGRGGVGAFGDRQGQSRSRAFLGRRAYGGRRVAPVRRLLRLFVSQVSGTRAHDYGGFHPQGRGIWPPRRGRDGLLLEVY